MNEIPDFDEVWQGARPEDFRDDPVPGWAGLGTLFGAPAVRLEDLHLPGGWAVAGVPFDGTASSRPGAAEGPRAVRQGSLVFSSSLNSLGNWPMLDTRTGRAFRYRAPRAADVGDLHVYPTDTVRTFRAVATESRQLLRCADKAVFLNGDHSTTFPTFVGFRAAHLERDSSATVGFVNVDHHFDYGGWSMLHGPLYHGSNSRRISERPGMRPENIAFIGVGDVTRYEQYRGLVEAGYHVVPGAQIARVGAHRALERIVAGLAERCDTVYVSLDVDVLDTSAASGTGHVTMGGIQVGHLFDVYEELRELPIGALDVAEIAPRYDGTGATAQIAARVLFEFLFRTDQRDSGFAPWSIRIEEDR